eukprot:PLAT8792.1.p1 GENE.PLAT8792.1~~PLAT8792.1.p1  ORF type:complete len:465 (+),score=223.39 PLAT8792.1:44-1438(+)
MRGKGRFRTQLFRDALRGLRSSIPAVDSVAVENGSHPGMRVVQLNRPKALNALSLEMIRFLDPMLRMWEEGEDVRAVVMRGEGGKAFCAGGDIVKLYNSGKEEETRHEALTFFREEYTLNHLLSVLDVPVVALLNGITMGGGVGLSVHGAFRVATEKSVFAMPETAIGFFPDVGGSHFLSRLPDGLGQYLGLTGQRLKGRDLLRAGIATHYIRADAEDDLLDSISHIASLGELTDRQLAMTMLAHFQSHTADEADSVIEPHREAIKRCFGEPDSMEGVLHALQSENSDWSDATLAALSNMSPTSLAVTHRQLQLGADKTLAECLAMEYRMAHRFMQGSDFFEGVRALLIDKDQSPKWEADSVADVQEATVASYFAPLEKASEELQLPARKRSFRAEAFADLSSAMVASEWDTPVDDDGRPIDVFIAAKARYDAVATAEWAPELAAAGLSLKDVNLADEGPATRD